MRRTRTRWVVGGAHPKVEKSCPSPSSLHLPARSQSPYRVGSGLSARRAPSSSSSAAISSPPPWRPQAPQAAWVFSPPTPFLSGCRCPSRNAPDGATESLVRGSRWRAPGKRSAAEETPYRRACLLYHRHSFAVFFVFCSVPSARRGFRCCDRSRSGGDRAPKKRNAEQTREASPDQRRQWVDGMVACASEPTAKHAKVDEADEEEDPLVRRREESCSWTRTREQRERTGGEAGARRRRKLSDSSERQIVKLA